VTKPKSAWKDLPMKSEVFNPASGTSDGDTQTPSRVMAPGRMPPLERPAGEPPLDNPIESRADFNTRLLYRLEREPWAELTKALRIREG
jgi:hypothetical protein